MLATSPQFARCKGIRSTRSLVFVYYAGRLRYVYTLLAFYPTDMLFFRAARDLFKLLHRYECQDYEGFTKCRVIFKNMVPSQEEIPMLLELAEVELYDLKFIWDRCLKVMRPCRKRGFGSISPAPARAGQASGNVPRVCPMVGPEWENLAKERPDIMLKALRMMAAEGDILVPEYSFPRNVSPPPPPPYPPASFEYE